MDLARVRTLFCESRLLQVLVVCAALYLYGAAALLGAVAGVDGAAATEQLPPRLDEADGKLLAGLKSERDEVARCIDENARSLKHSLDSGVQPFHAGVGQGGLRLALDASPPQLRVRAIAICAGARVALVEPDGGKSRLMREGELLDGGHGMVTAISRDRLVWSWGGHEMVSLVEE